MKFLSENQSNNGSSSSNINNSSNLANWLGFSLSPHMKMESTSPPNTSTDISQQHNQYHHHYHNHHQAEQLQQQQQQQQSNMSMFLAAHQQQQLNSGAVCYDVGGGENSGAFLHTPLTVMPLKSDGSLCIMEALTRSQQPEVVHAAPKLEDFLGSSQERGTMALSLDSLYYQHTAEQEAHRQQQQQFESYFSAMACQGFSYEGLFKNWINTNADNMNDGLVDNGGSSSVTLAAPPVTCGDLQSLTLSMSPGSQSSCVTAGTDSCVVNAMETNKKRGFGKVGHKHTVHRKSIESFGQRTSQYRGVTKHRWTGRYEAHLWDNSCKKEGQTRKGRQVYLGGYDMEEKAARSYDLAALKYWGLQTHTNFPIESYNDEIEHMKNMTRQEYVAHLRRKSSGFSRGASMYRGVTRHHQHGRWQARIGRVAGNKDLYLGTFSTQEEAAEAYDVAAIRFRGISAVTNFDISRYDVEKIMDSNTLLAGEQAKRSKVEPLETIEASPSVENAGDATVANDGNSPVDWKMVLYNSHGEQQTSSCMNGGYGNPSFSLALQDLVGLETGSPTSQAMGEDSNKLGAAHFSNASSLVTSLNSSREGSPDKNGTSSSPMASRFVNPVSIVNPWMISSQLRPAAAAIPVAHLPVFAAWGDT